MPSPCLLCRHHHRRRRHRYAPSSPTCRRAVPQRVVLSPVAVVVVVVVSPAAPWHRRRAAAGRRQIGEPEEAVPLTAGKRGSSPTQEKTFCSSTSDASVVTAASTTWLPWSTGCPIESSGEKGGRRRGRCRSTRAGHHHLSRYRVRRRKARSTPAGGGGGGGGGGERGDSRPSRCTRCRTERDAPRAKAETIASGSNPCAAECCSRNRSRSRGPAVVPVPALAPVLAPVLALALAPVPVFALVRALAIARERADRRRPIIGEHGSSWLAATSVASPRSVWARYAPSPAATAVPRRCCRPICSS